MVRTQFLQVSVGLGLVFVHLFRFSVFCAFMVALCNRADHYILPCDFYLLSFFLFFSPNLSGLRLDVCHTSAHGVALV